jgi:hypothetical protein
MQDRSENTSPLPAAAPRKFGVGDLMIIIGGIAVLIVYGRTHFIALAQQVYGLCFAFAGGYGLISPGPAGKRNLLNMIPEYWNGVVWEAVQVAELLILSSMFAVLIMRLRRPRPPVYVLLRQPGTIAGLAGAFSVVVVLGWLHRLYFGRLVEATVAPVAVGATVALAWTCLALRCTWAAEPTWLDRLGRFLGAAAITNGLIALWLYGIWR